MRLLPTEQEEVATVAARWEAQYSNGGKWGTLLIGNSKVIYERLAALPPKATAKDVADIIGNDGWIGDTCTECKAKAVVLVGDEPDYESHTVYLCVKCVRALSKLVGEMK